jgi:hypothetical protein
MLPTFKLLWLATMVVAGLVVLALPSSVSWGQQKSDTKKAASAQKKMALEVLKRQEAQGLQYVYTLLASANNNYGGHQIKAMHEVEAALKLLEGKAAKQLQQAITAQQNAHKHVHALLGGAAAQAETPEMQAISDAQVAHASSLLQHFVEILAANKQQNVLKHVEKAIKELAAAPKHDTAAAALKAQQANVLVSAYVLLASANHDYQGHRVKAMTKIEHASNILQADMLKQASVQDKIKAIQDANTEAQAKNLNKQDPAITEPQAASDAQLLLAGAMLQAVSNYVDDTKQKTLKTHLKDAHAEITSALTVR